MKSLSEICSGLPDGEATTGGVSSIQPLIPGRINFYRRNGISYRLWNRVFCHEKFIMVYMISGKRVVNIEDCSYTLEKGEIIIIPPFAKHSFGDQFRDFEALMASFVLPVDSRRLLNVAAQSWKLGRREEKTIRTILEAYFRREKGDVGAGEEAVCLFAVLLRQIQSIAAPELNEHHIEDADLPLLNRITAYLAANRHRRVTIDELSKKLHVSGSTLRQTFRKKMDVSIGRYQLIRRLMLGLQMLKSTDLSVAEIAAKVGFASANGFMLAIKRECDGRPPSAARRDKKVAK